MKSRTEPRMAGQKFTRQLAIVQFEDEDEDEDDYEININIIF